MPCAVCDHANPDGARFCGGCGARLEAKCPRCGSALAGALHFCTGCGFDLRDPAATPVAPPTAPASPATAAAGRTGAPEPLDDGERRHATVMFSDLSGYTALNESADPEVVEELMGRIKGEASSVIARLGGTVNQFVGDEIMAIFGVPLAHGDDPRRAVQAALELHRAVTVVLAGFEHSGPALAMHTGIASGLVVARRSDARAGDYALTGDTVNTAARLRSLAAPGEIVVSAETWQQVAVHFHAEAGAAVEVKGKERPLVPWRIQGPRSSAGEARTPLVGRVEELRDFDALAEACAERGRSRVVVVRGDPGVGKSRLVAEFVETARRRGFRSHAAAVLDFGAETGRDAVRSLARSLLGVADSADESSRRAALERATERHAIEPDRRIFLHDLADVPVPPSLRALSAAMSTAARDKGSVQALCELASQAVEEAPLLLLVEDIHWADAWTLERLAALAVLAARLPLLLVMTTRFAGDPTAGAWRTALHGAPLIGIDLGVLTTTDATQLAAILSRMPPEVVATCVERAEGNPLFLSQLLLNAGENAQANLPGSIQALVHARMDRLPLAQKAALQAAAVLGQRYSLDALRHVTADPTCDCALLTEQFLVRPDGAEFLFCHALIRDGAYASLLHSRRRALHARAAEWFSASDPILAAEHFDRGEHPRAALAYLAASEVEAAQFRPASALALVTRGLELGADAGTRFPLLMAQSRLLLELGRAADAIEAARAAREAAAQPRERAQALIGMAAAMRLNDRIADGLATLDEAEPLAVAEGLELELSRLHHLRGNLLFPLGRHAECLRAHELARDHARAADSLEAEAAALGGIGDAHYLHGHMRSANQEFRECVALARKHGFGRLVVANLPMIGWSGLHLGDTAGAAEVARQAIDLAVQAAQPRAEALSRNLLAWIDGVIRDRRAEAMVQSDAALALIRMLGARRFEAQVLCVTALLEWRSGAHNEAREIADRALAICREHGMGHIGPWAFGVRALAEPDPAARLALLAQGEAELARGSVSHNHIQLRELAIDACLEIGAWDEVEANCAHILAYTAAEPLPMAQFIVDRGRALARFHRGERSDDLRAALRTLDDFATAAEATAARAAIASALAAFESPAAFAPAAAIEAAGSEGAAGAAGPTTASP